MASARSNSSPRDHAADSNPDLSRKKQRLFERPSTSSSDDPVVVEVLESDDTGHEISPAIELDNDPFIMPSYSSTFTPYGSVEPPDAQVCYLDSILERDGFIDEQVLNYLDNWLSSHLTKTEHDVQFWAQQYPGDDSSFFAEFARFCINLLDRNHPLTSVSESLSRRAEHEFRNFLENLIRLCSRILPLLPQVLKSTMSRRDSAQDGPKPCSTGLLLYTTVTAKLLSEITPAISYLSSEANVDARDLVNHHCLYILSPTTLQSIPPIVRTISTATREIKDSWTILQGCFMITGRSMLSYRSLATYPQTPVEDLLETLNSTIMVSIREKHPRALPERFQNDMFVFGNDALRTHIYHHDRNSAFRIYRLFVKGDADSVLPRSVDDEDNALSALWKNCQENKAEFAGILATSWTMQHALAFVRSEVMEVRNLGLKIIVGQLVNIFKRIPQGSQELPLMEFAIRFLRINDVVKYIFGAESHASLVWNSREIVEFLAATCAFTDVETDIIWHACSNNVETDFVKAAFGALDALLDRLDFGHLRYILMKYVAMDIERLGHDAIDFLPRLFHALEMKTSLLTTVTDRLSLPFFIIELLKKTRMVTTSTTAPKLRKVALDEMAKLCFGDSEMNMKMRMEIYRRVVPDIIGHGPDATTAFEVINLLWNRPASATETQEILTMLPIAGAVDELGEYIDKSKHDTALKDAIQNLNLRLTFIFEAISEDLTDLEDNVQQRLFQYVFGESALCARSRDEAWNCVHCIAEKEESPTLNRLLQQYLESSVPALPTNFATPRLICLLQGTIQLILKEDDELTVAELLDLPTWRTLLQIARDATDGLTVKKATSTICDLLFLKPGESEVDHVAFQSAFTRSLVETLCQDYQAAKSLEATRGLALLDAVFSKSKEILAEPAAPSIGDSLTLDPIGTDLGGSPLTLTAHIHGPGQPVKAVSIEAYSESKFSQLLHQLSILTGAPRHRLIFGGRELKDSPGKSLAGAGLNSSGALQVAPRYDFALGSSPRLLKPNPVEQQIIEQYDFLETFLDGDHDFAFKAFTFLNRLHCVSRPLQKIISADATLDEIFPATRPWRSMFSLHTVTRHLHDCARLGMVDTGFVLKGIRLLTSLILDENRPFDSEFLREACCSLLDFLRGSKHDSYCDFTSAEVVSERPDDVNSVKYFEQSSKFVSRLFDLLFQVREVASDRNEAPRISETRRHLAVVAYQVLLEAFILDRSVWDAFVANERTAMVHKTLLLDNEKALSATIANLIKRFFENAPPLLNTPHLYWTALIHFMPEALESGNTSASYFDLVADIFNNNMAFRHDEAQVRSILDGLVVRIWTFRHAESVTGVAPDKAMAGLLKLFNIGLMVLKSYKRPMGLNGLATSIFRKFLFPSFGDPDSHPLVFKTSRNLAYRLVNLSFEPQHDLKTLVEDVSRVAEITPKDPISRYPGHENWVRPVNKCAGLVNLGMTCYMNSMLQQLFANVPFRKFLLELPSGGSRDNGLLYHIQCLFAQMQESRVPNIDTSTLAKALGLEVGNQEDVHGFYAIFLAQIEECMPDAASKADLTRFFTGQSVTQIRGDCGHVSARTEPFSDLSITVKNKGSLHDSLDEFVQGEPMEGANKYRCTTCTSENGGKLVNAMKRTCLETIPPNLTFCLKRFTFDLGFDGENKVNDRFEFPGEIDMAAYTRTRLEDPNSLVDPDVFELVGVIIHQGSLAFGHYWSYVRLPHALSPDGHVWVYLEDSHVHVCEKGLREVQEQSFGGLHSPNGHPRVDNAYVLFYQRRSYVSEAQPMSIQPSDLFDQSELAPPRIAIPDELIQPIVVDNRWRQQVDFVFDEHLFELTKRLLDECTSFFEASSESIMDRMEISELRKSAEPEPDDVFDSEISLMATETIIRTVRAHPKAEQRITPFMTSFKHLLAVRPKTAYEALCLFFQDEFGISGVAHHINSEYRIQVNSMLEICLQSVREHHPRERYEQVAMAFVRMHSILLKKPVDGMFDNWDEVFPLISDLAAEGSFETGLVLEAGFLSWTVEAFNARHDPHIHNIHKSLASWAAKNKIDYSPIFSFMYALLSNGHIDVSNLDELAHRMGGLVYSKTDRGWSLQPSEARLLLNTIRERNRDVMMVCFTGTRYCYNKTKWEDFGPGQLIGLLAANPDPRFFRHIESSMMTRYDCEEDFLEPLLYTTLHICNKKEDTEMRDLLKNLARNLLLWESFEHRSLWFFDCAYQMSPVSVIETIPDWSPEFLQVKSVNTRNETAAWLSRHIFDLQPLSEHDDKDLTRVRATRAFLERCMEWIEHAYKQRKAKTTFLAMIDAMNHARDYVDNLSSEILIREESARSSVPISIRLEADEAGRVVRQLADLQGLLIRWSSEPSLPTRMASHTIGVSHEVEESDGPESSDEDDLSSEKVID